LFSRGLLSPPLGGLLPPTPKGALPLLFVNMLLPLRGRPPPPPIGDYLHFFPLYGFW